MIKLTHEQTEQAVQHPTGVRCQGNGIDRIFFIVDADVLVQMQEAIARSNDAAIRAGINDMEAGRMQPAEDAHRHGREALIFRYQP